MEKQPIHLRFHTQSDTWDLAQFSQGVNTARKIDFKAALYIK